MLMVRMESLLQTNVNGSEANGVLDDVVPSSSSEVPTMEESQMVDAERRSGGIEESSEVMDTKNEVNTNGEQWIDEPSDNRVCDGVSSTQIREEMKGEETEEVSKERMKKEENANTPDTREVVDHDDVMMESPTMRNKNPATSEEESHGISAYLMEKDMIEKREECEVEVSSGVKVDTILETINDSKHVDMLDRVVDRTMEESIDTEEEEEEESMRYKDVVRSQTLSSFIRNSISGIREPCKKCGSMMKCEVKLNGKAPMTLMVRLSWTSKIYASYAQNHVPTYVSE